MPQSHDYPVSAMPINHAIRPGPAHSAIHTRTTLPRNIQFGLSFISDLVAWQQMPSFRDAKSRSATSSSAFNQVNPAAYLPVRVSAVRLARIFNRDQKLES